MRHEISELRVRTAAHATLTTSLVGFSVCWIWIWVLTIVRWTAPPLWHRN